MVISALLLFALCGVVLAGAAGVGTFSIEGSTAGFGVNQFGLATLYLESTWDPRADDVFISVTWDPSVVQYVSTDWKVGNSVAATLKQPGELFLQFADWTNQYPSGRFAIADINFRGLAAGQTTLDLQVDHVRSHVAASSTNFVDLTQSALTSSGTLVVGGGGTAPTPPVVTAPPIVTVPPTEPALTPGTAVPTAIMTELPTPVTPVSTVPTDSTTPIVSLTPVPTQFAPTSVPYVPIPIAGAGGEVEDYTGVRTSTPTVSTTLTPNATTAGGTPTVGSVEDGQVTSTAAPPISLPPSETMPFLTSVPETVSSSMTTVPTTVPPATTPTRAGPGLLVTVVGLLVALVAAGRRG